MVKVCKLMVKVCKLMVKVCKLMVKVCKLMVKVVGFGPSGFRPWGPFGHQDLGFGALLGIRI